MRTLDKYPYCDHAVILRKRKNNWQNTEYVLRMFAKKVSTACSLYREFVKKGMAQGKRPELVGRGLVRSLGGWSAVKALRKVGAYMKCDERILGSGDFVEGILAQAKEDLELRGRKGDRQIIPYPVQVSIVYFTVDNCFYSNFKTSC